MQGAGALFHVAADYRLWARNRRNPGNNLAMTRAVMERGAVGRRLPRGLYLQRGDAAAARWRWMKHPATPEQATGIYKRARWWPKGWSRRWWPGGPARRDRQPSTPIGPRDVRPTPTGRVVVEAANGKMPAYVDTG
jgi:dihydroflavonol-4-reductase